MHSLDLRKLAYMYAEILMASLLGTFMADPSFLQGTSI